MSMSPFQIVTALWAVATICYVALFVLRSIVGQKEEDTLFLSAGESRMEAEQHQVMKQITRLESYSHKVGFVALTLTLVLAGMWLYSVAQNLHLW